MKHLNWLGTRERNHYMGARQVENLNRARHNRHENWMMDKLFSTGLKWTRQAIWGYRLFDFWNHEKGISVEVDGPDHQARYDAYRDEYNFRRSGIVVLRVRNGNELEATRTLEFIKSACLWSERRAMLGLMAHASHEKRELALMPYPPSFLKEYVATGEITRPQLSLFDEALQNRRDANVARFGH